MSGRIAPASALGNDVHGELVRIIAEGSRPVGEQQHGVSQAEVAYAQLALAHVDFARGEVNTAREDIRHAGDVGYEDQSFAEAAIDALYAIGNLPHAQNFAARALATWPTSWRTRVALAQIYTALGRTPEALDVLSKPAEMLEDEPMPLVVRGYARLAGAELEGAKADFDAALGKLAGYEPAVMGRAMLNLDAGLVDEARKLIEPRFKEATASPALMTIYAAILRRGSLPADRNRAKQLLDKVTVGPPGLDAATGFLELARFYREAGDFRAARQAYADASRNSVNFDARLEAGLLQIEIAIRPAAARQSMRYSRKPAIARPAGSCSPRRARACSSEIARARRSCSRPRRSCPISRSGSSSARRRGRLALRRSDFAGAILALGKALDGCGADAETFLLAADAAETSDEKGAADLASRVKRLISERLKSVPRARWSQASC